MAGLRWKRRKRILKPVPVLGFLLVVMLGLLGLLVSWGSREEASLRLACAAGLREPMTAVAEAFEDETGMTVEIRFGGSGELAGQLEVIGSDLYFPADEDYLVPLLAEGRVAEVFAVVKLRAGLVVASGNPLELEKLGDLAREGVRISLADRSAAIGKLTWRLLEDSGRFKEIERNVVVTKPTVNGVVEDVALGAVDVTLAWDAVAANYEGVEWIALEEPGSMEKVAAVAVMASGERREDALRFARYVADREKGGRIFAAMGFQGVEERK